MFKNKTDKAGINESGKNVHEEGDAGVGIRPELRKRIKSRISCAAGRQFRIQSSPGIYNTISSTSKTLFFCLFVHFFGAITQFAGGLDAETLCAFEEIRQRFQGSSAGSRELLAANANANAVPSS